MDKFTDLDNCGDINKDRTMDWMAWAAMRRDEVKDKLKYTGKTGNSKIDILLYYWKCRNVIIMVKVTGLYTLDDEAIRADGVKFELPRRTGTVNY